MSPASMSRWFPPGVKSSSQAYEALMDQLMSEVSGGAWKVVCFIARRCVGFGKPGDRISLSQFCRGVRGVDRGTGLNRTAVIRGLRELESQGVIRKTPAHGRRSARYSINWPSLPQSQNETSSESLPVTSSESGPELVANRDPQPASQPAVLQPAEGLRDSDYLPTNRKRRDSQAGPAVASEVPADWKNLSELVAQMLGRAPTRSGLGRIVSATPNGTGAEAVEAIQDPVRRGYGADGKNPPRSVSWFVSVVQNYWADRTRRAVPPSPPDTGTPPGELDRMTAAFDTLPEPQREPHAAPGPPPQKSACPKGCDRGVLPGDELCDCEPGNFRRQMLERFGECRKLDHQEQERIRKRFDCLLVCAVCRQYSNPLHYPVRGHALFCPEHCLVCTEGAGGTQ